MKVLVTRTDRLGDLVLSLPVFAYLAEARPDWQVHAMVAPAAVPLVENDPAVAALWTWPEGEPERADLERRLAAERFDAAIMLLYDAELAALLRRCGVPLRYGPLSKWSSWRLLNRGVWQRRSRGADHEMVHNLRLARRAAAGWWAGRGDADSWPEPRLHLGAGQRAAAAEFRRAHAAGAEAVVFVHPGSGGSALDWTPDSFAVVANALALTPGRRVFVTGAGEDAASVGAMRRAGLSDAVPVLLDRYPLRDFLGVLSAGDVFIGPSTGPLHMAAALGLATVGLFPPVPTMSPRRWGQRGPWNRSLVPDVRCPGRRVCLKQRCSLYNCLSGILPAQVLEAAEEMMRRRAAGVANRKEES